MSLDRVRTTVLDGAKAEAEKIVAAARLAAEKVAADAKTTAATARSDAVREAKTRLERDTGRELERIQHENRLHVLEAKNGIIDAVFAKVVKELAAMPDDDFVGMVGKWLKSLPPEAGGVLRVNPKDEARFAARLDSLNSGRKGAGKFAKVVADPKVPSGAIVEGADFSVDCTVELKLAELRETAAGDLARILFGA